MTALSITLLSTAVLALILVWLSIAVVIERARAKISFGDGSTGPVRDGEQPGKLQAAIRAQAHFAEYVPLSVILLGLVEGRGGNATVLWILAAVLVAARVVHPLGMRLKTPNPARVVSTTAQWLVLAVGALYGLWLYAA